MHQAVKTGFLLRRLPSEPNRLGHDIKLSRWAENLRPTKGAGPAGGGVLRFFLVLASAAGTRSSWTGP